MKNHDILPHLSSIVVLSFYHQVCFSLSLGRRGEKLQIQRTKHVEATASFLEISIVILPKTPTPGP